MLFTPSRNHPKPKKNAAARHHKRPNKISPPEKHSIGQNTPYGPRHSIEYQYFRFILKVLSPSRSLRMNARSHGVTRGLGRAGGMEENGHALKIRARDFRSLRKEWDHAMRIGQSDGLAASFYLPPIGRCKISLVLRSSARETMCAGCFYR